MEATIQKKHIALGLSVLALVPWFAGGREPGGLFVSLAVLALAGFMIWRSEDIRPLRWGVVPASFGLLAIWSAASLIWSVNRTASLQWCALLMLAAASFTIVRMLVAADVKIREQWAWGYVVLAVAVAIFGMYDFFAHTGFDRLTSWFYWPNAAAAFLLPGICFGLSWLRQARGWKDRSLLGGVTVIMLVGFWLTASRGAAVALLLVAAAVIVMTVRTQWRWLLVCTGLLAGSWAVSAGLVSLRSQALHTTQNSSIAGRVANSSGGGQSYSITDRKNFLLSAYDMWRHQPIIGNGGGTYGTLHPYYQRRVTSASAHAHNLYAQLFAELGLVGGIAGVVLVLGLLWQAFTAARTQPGLAPYAAALVMLLIHFGLDMDSLYATLVILMAALAGFTFTNATGVRVPRSGALFGVLLVVALAAAYPAFYAKSQADRAASDQEHNDYPQAAVGYDRATLGPWPNSAYMVNAGINYYTLAGYYINRSANLATAEDRAHAAIAANPEDAAGYYLLAHVQDAKGQTAAAEQNYRTTLQKDPYNHPEYYGTLAAVYIQDHKTAQARQLLDSGIKLYDQSTISNRSFIPNFATNVKQLQQLRHELGE